MIEEYTYDRDQLEGRARLVRVRDGSVALEVARRRREAVRVVARLHGHREHRARAWVEHDRARALRVPLVHGLAQDLLRARLDAVVEAQEDVAAGRCRPLLLDVDHAAG